MKRSRLGAVIATAGLLAAGVALGGGLIGNPAIASAEWDIGAYDACTDAAGEKLQNNQTSWLGYISEYNGCCRKTGGVLRGDPTSSAAICYAPPATASIQPPERPLPNSTATATLEPGPGNASESPPPAQVG
jgi:hypothetical protein